MGGSNYSNDDYITRSAFRKSTGTPVFAYNAAVQSGKAHGVHPSLNPKGVKIRESRDSDVHPVAVPVALCNDLTGSMQDVPVTLQREEPKLMGLFLKDRADGKTYLGEGYPAIMIAGVDDYAAIGAEGSLQVGQFESGLEIDDNLSNLWLTGNGGGNWAESYDLFLYFLARHTAHDHFDKRGKKGHAFIICDEPLKPSVRAREVSEVIGDSIPSDIPIQTVIEEVKERYWLFCIIPNQTTHYEDDSLVRGWKTAIGTENVLKLDDPTKICELIVATVAMCEGTTSLGDLVSDNVATRAVEKALIPLSKVTDSSVSRYSAAGLPSIPGSAGGVSRL